MGRAGKFKARLGGSVGAASHKLVQALTHTWLRGQGLIALLPAQHHWHGKSFVQNKSKIVQESSPAHFPVITGLHVQMREPL